MSAGLQTAAVQKGLHDMFLCSGGVQGNKKDVCFDTYALYAVISIFKLNMFFIILTVFIFFHNTI